MHYTWASTQPILLDIPLLSKFNHFKDKIITAFGITTLQEKCF